VAKAVSCVFDQIQRLEEQVFNLRQEQDRLRVELAQYRADEEDTVS
jgi:serine O-acetyltransferase